jgi:hypothetical protein
MKILPIVINPVLQGTSLINHYNVDIENLIKEVSQELSKVLDVSIEFLPLEFSGRIPIKQDGFQYTEEQYAAVIQDGSIHHEADLIDYQDFMYNFSMISRRQNKEFDEVWVYGGPFMGFHESQMVGETAYVCNSPPIEAPCSNFVIMGFNYERGVGEALEAFGHRTEFIFRHHYPIFWNKYSKQIGTIHEPFNTTKAYDWSNHDMGIFNGSQKANCELWNCDGKEYIKWWFKHLPTGVKYATTHVEY